MITHLKSNEVFVFGSNLGGRHAGGAAYLAAERFGAQEGVGEGLTGQSYAFPTLTASFEMVTMEALETSRDRLFATAQAHPEKTFLLTKVGCGIAGFREEQIRPLFRNPPENVVLPEDWSAALKFI
ncbi:MAG: hypothetical protein ABL967_06460 [Bryobacteraceae bacterium]